MLERSERGKRIFLCGYKNPESKSEVVNPVVATSCTAALCELVREPPRSPKHTDEARNSTVARAKINQLPTKESWNNKQDELIKTIACEIPINIYASAFPPISSKAVIDEA